MTHNSKNYYKILRENIKTAYNIYDLLENNDIIENEYIASRIQKELKVIEEELEQLVLEWKAYNEPGKD
jgi:mevalonate kinase